MIPSVFRSEPTLKKHLTHLLPLGLVAFGLMGACGSSSESNGAGNVPAPEEPECAEDSECDDGDPCTGEEICEETDGTTVCRSVEPVECDEEQSCDRATGECLDPGCDADGDGFDSVECGGDDCDDSDSNRYPSNEEVCVDADGMLDPATAEHDEDCDPTTLGSDQDGDGFYPTECANEDANGNLVFGDDCDDENRFRHPGLDEICDGLDNDCSGGLDFPGEDDDEDGFADCEDLSDQAQFDCDDEDDSIFPGAEEACDGIDSNCDGQVEDEDEDGFAAEGDECTGGPLPKTDCDDDEPLATPIGTEICNGIDSDCSGEVDDGDAALNSCGAMQTNGTPACIEAQCDVSCDVDYGNCDDNLGTGCESYLPTAIRHCGACGNVCAIGCAASSCQEEWVQQWGSAVGDSVAAIVVDGNGDTWVAWYGDANSHLTKLDASGTEIWTKAFLGVVVSSEMHLAIDSSGNVYGAGNASGNVVVRRFDSDGEPIWTETYSVTGLTTVEGIAVNAAGASYVAGNAGASAFVSTVSAAGSFVDDFTWTSGGTDTVKDLVVSSAGDVYVAGYTTGTFPSQTGQAGSDAFVSHFDSALALQTTVQWGTGGEDRVAAIASDPSNNLYVAGHTNGDLAGAVGSNDAFVTKLSSSAVIQTSTQWGTTSGEQVSGVAVDGTGRAVVVGQTSGNLDGEGNRGNTDPFVTFLDASGVVETTEQWGGMLDDAAEHVFSSSAGDAYIAGITRGDLDGEGNANSAPTTLEARQDVFALRLNR